MTSKSIRIRSSLVAFSMFGAWSPAALAGGVIPLTPQDANLFIQLESAAHGLDLVAGLVGGDPGNPLAWSGTVSSSGWTYAMSTPYRDGNLILNYDGVFDASSDLITWTGSGKFTNPFGSLSWTSNGSYTDAIADGFFGDAVRFAAAGITALVTITGDVAVAGIQSAATVATVGGAVVVIGGSVTAIGGITAAGLTVIDKLESGMSNDEKVSLDNHQSGATPPFSDPFPITTLPGLVNNNFPSVSVVTTGVISGDFATEFSDAGTSRLSVPEPSSWVMLCLGFAGVGLWRARRARTA